MSEQHYEEVNNPPHYGGADNPFEATKVMYAWGYGPGFDLGCVLKYLCRQGDKPGLPALKDLKKAQWYLNNAIAQIEKEQAEAQQKENNSTDEKEGDT